MARSIVAREHLEALGGHNRVLFRVNGLNTPRANYMTTIVGIRRACSTPTQGVATQIHGKPLTVMDPPNPVMVVHVVGPFDGFQLNHLLMIEKCSLYFYACNGEGGWHEVKESCRPIINATKFGFRGMYNEMDGELTCSRLKVGFVPLVRAIVNIVSGRARTVYNFLNVCLNLCEASRIPELAEIVAGTMLAHLQIERSLSVEIMYWIKQYGQCCKAVRNHSDSGQWEFEGRLNGAPVTLTMVIGAYGIILCQMRTY